MAYHGHIYGSREPTVRSNSMSSIVIVGGGIIGTSIACALGHHRDVTVLEKNTLGSGTTAASMGRPDWSTPHPFETYLQRRAWKTYEPLIEDGTIGFDRCGFLVPAHGGSQLEELREKATRLGSYGLEFELLEGDAVERHGLDPDAVSGGLYLPDGGYMNQQDAVEHFAETARASGARIETGTAVTDVTTDHGSVTGVETTDGPHSAEIVVNAAGPWVPKINRFVDVSLPLRHTRGPILVLEESSDLSIPYLSGLEGDFYFRPEGDSKALAGRRWGRYGEAERLDPDAALEVEATFRHDVGRIAETYVPRLADASVINEWIGLRTITPDFKPIVGEVPDAPEGFLVACGMSGAGVSLAPVVGSIIADTVDGTDSDLRRILSAARFGAGRAVPETE